MSDNYRFVFTDLQGGTSHSNVALAEIEMHLSNGGSDITGVAENSTSAHHSIGAEFPTYAAIDDDDTTMWNGSSTSTLLSAGGVWWRIDFTDDQEIIEYVFTSRSSYLDDTPIEWEVQRWNGTSWDILETESTTADWTASESRTFSIVLPVILPAGAGTYSIIGSPADLRINKIESAPGTYIITGSNVALIVHKITVGAGSYTITGSNVELVNPKFVITDSGAYTINGSDVEFRINKIPADPGAYTITGSDVTFKIGTGPATVGTIVYLFTLTGTEDSTTDVEIPIKSFQARLRSGSPTYLNVVIPGISYASHVTARPNGTMKVDIAWRINGELTNRETIIQANLEDIRVDKGAENQSISLTGHKQVTYSPKTITLSDATYKNTINGEIRYRFPTPNVYLHPGDTVVVDSDTFVAGVISYYVSTRLTTMEVAEI